MIIKKIDLDSLGLLDIEQSPTPIVGHFSNYFSNFNLERVLVVTDENIITDLRVINQLRALNKLTDDIVVIQVKPDNKYNEKQKKLIIRTLYIKSLFNFIYFIWLFLLSIIHKSYLNLRTKAKQGIYNDHSYILMNKISTSDYTCVICNNLISASSIDYHDSVDYIYDIHELEVFRNRNKASLQRAFYVYLKEMEEIKRNKNIITISKFNANILSQLYFLNKERISCIYNQNFNNQVVSQKKIENDEYLLIYIGSVSVDRGLADIVSLSHKYDILVIACNYKEDAIEFLVNNCVTERLTIFKGMDYQDFLQQELTKYSFPFFLILINPTHPSYRYALPNKFFQAQALDCPIIAYDDTYLAKVITKYKCGLIFPRNREFQLDAVDKLQYESMKISMIREINKAIENEEL